MAKIREKYEDETEKRMCSFACKLLIFALLTAALFVGYSFSVLIG